jgi:hypothetical protein
LDEPGWEVATGLDGLAGLKRQAFFYCTLGRSKFNVTDPVTGDGCDKETKKKKKRGGNDGGDWVV